jgi:D-alanyl-D-alanine carboxypeptidase
VQPIRVWIGLNPPSETDLATQAAEEDAADQARKSKGRKPGAKRLVAEPKLPLPAGAIEEGKGKSGIAGKNGRASLSLKPVSGADITKDSSSAAKPPAAKAAVTPVKAKVEPKKPAKPEAKPDVKADAAGRPATKTN